MLAITAMVVLQKSTADRLCLLVLSIASEGRDFHVDWFLRALEVIPPLDMV